MGGAPLLLALAVVTADVGWEPDGRDGYRYIIQVPAEQLADVQRMGSITSEIPAELRGRVTSVIVRVGDAELPQPQVVPAEPPEPADRHVANEAAANSSVYPSPPDTVRAQGGSGEIEMPSIEEMHERTRRDAEDVRNGVTSALQTGAQDAIDATSRSFRETANQAVTAGTDAARNMMSATAPSTDPARSAAPPNRYGHSDFNGFAPAAPSDPAAPGVGSSSPYSPIVPSTSSTRGSAPPSAAGPPAVAQPSASGRGGTASMPPSNSGQVASNDPPSFPYTPTPNAASTNAPASSAPPGGLATQNNAPIGAGLPQSSNSWGGPDLTATNDAVPPRSFEEQQRLADERLLNDIGFQDDKAYDKKTGDWIREDDARLPQIRDYVSRQQAEQRQRSEQQLAAQQLAAQQLAAQKLAAQRRAAALGYDYPPAEASGRSDDGYRGWSDPQIDRYASTAGRPIGGIDAAANNRPLPPSDRTGNPAANETHRESDRETAGSGAAAPPSPSDLAKAEQTEPRRAKVAIEPQPFYNFLLLLSIVINVYLGIAISRLLRRYRNLVATHRGTAVSALSGG